jgi:hypothetical protein
MSENTTQPDGGGATGTPIPDALLNAQPALKKFASMEALAQSYSELEKTFGKKTSELDTMRKLLAEVQEGVNFDPESAEVPQGLRPYMEQYAEMGIKEDVAKQLAVQEAARDAQINSLQTTTRDLELNSMWGAQTKSRIEAVTSWAESNLDPVTVGNLSNSAAGMQNLRILMESSIGGSVTQPNGIPPEGPQGRIVALKKERDAIYEKGGLDSDWNAQNRVNEIMSEITELSG